MIKITRSFYTPIPWGKCPKCGVRCTVEGKYIIEIGDPNWMGGGPEHGTFAVNVCCKKCSTPIISAGTWFMEPNIYYDEEGEEQYSESLMYYVHFCDPAPNIFTLKVHVPGPIKDAIDESFRAYWVSNELAAVSIRKALEALCKYLKINKKNLHRRLLYVCSIDYEDGIYTDLEDIALATKWLCNDGAHQIGSVDQNKIQFAFEAIQTFLERILAGDSLHKRAKVIRDQFEKVKKNS